jgi:alpha-beta hydrolase superfamily lysophospholipase
LPEFRTFRATDGYEFAYRHVPAVGDSKARLVFLHGIRSHGGWYERSCAEFSARGFDVDFLDRRGAGKNQRQRGDCPNARRLIDDVAEFIRNTPSPAPTLVAGISWGGKVALALPAVHPGLVTGVILITPGIVPLVTVPLTTKLRIALARFINPTKPFAIPLNDPELFTTSPNGLRVIEDDPLGLRTATARFLFESIRLDLFLRRNLPTVSCPVLLLSAGRDRIADAGQSRAVLARGLPPGQLSERTYPDAHHTLEFEDACPFVADVAAWVETVALRPSPRP